MYQSNSIPKPFPIRERLGTEILLLPNTRFSGSLAGIVSTFPMLLMSLCKRRARFRETKVIYGSLIEGL